MNTSLNDSDDSAFIFKSPAHKRKLKLVTPKSKRRKVGNKNEVPRNATIRSSSQGGVKSVRKSSLNRSAPVASTSKNAGAIHSFEFSRNNISMVMEPVSDANDEAHTIQWSPSKKSSSKSPEIKIKNHLELNKPVKICPKGQEPEHEITSKTFPTSVVNGNKDYLLCPLCPKKFDNTSTHVSHMKQCAKKKKIPVTELLKKIEQKNVAESSCEHLETKPKPSTSKEDIRKDGESITMTYDLAVATAMSLSLSYQSSEETSKTSVVDRRVIATQKATLEKYGFTSSSSIAGKSSRRGKLQKNSNTVLRSRTAEERLRLVTEKAAVILLSENDDLKLKEQVVNNDKPLIQSQQLPYQSETPKLWQLGESQEQCPWYLENLKEHILPEPSKVHKSKKAVGTTLPEDWGRLVGNPLWSDKEIKSRDGVVPIHSLVLHARCPKVEISNVEEVCQEVSRKALIKVLQFLYTGKLASFEYGEVEEAKRLSKVFQRQEIMDSIAGPNQVFERSEDFILSSISPHIEPRLMSNQGEGDTVPIYPEMSWEKECEYRTEQLEDSDVVDLTNSNASSPHSHLASNADSCYWNNMRRDLDEEQEHLEVAQERAKIQSFIEEQSSKPQEDDDDEEDLREMEKIYRLSQCNDEEIDLFDEADELQVLYSSPKKVSEVITVSDSDDNFDGSTDEEVLPDSEKKKNFFDMPFFASAEGKDFTDDLKTSSAMETLPSQSLVNVVMSPKTPRKVLESPLFTHAKKQCEPESCMLPEPQPSCLTYDTTPVTVGIEGDLKSTPEMISKSTGNKRRSVGYKIIRRSVRALHERARRSARRSLITDKQSKEIEELLSASVQMELNNSWREEATPKFQSRPFIEITPKATPSVRLVDNVTPQPNFNAMNTASLKKHLQKYGLKKSLGKTKARKILNHIYEELHPVMNTRTGKLVKFLSEENCSSRGKSSARNSKVTCGGRGSSGGKKLRSSPRISAKVSSDCAGPSGARRSASLKKGKGTFHPNFVLEKGIGR